MEKIILLDVDGVILPFSRKKTRHTISIPLEYGEALTDDRVKSWLQEISQAVDIYWCTSWEEHAELFANTLGFKTKGVLKFYDIGQDNPEYSWYKLKAIEEFCQAHPEAQIALIDDSVNAALVDESPVVREMRQQGKLLLVRPVSEKGLVKKDIRQVNRWFAVI